MRTMRGPTLVTLCLLAVFCVLFVAPCPSTAGGWSLANWTPIDGSSDGGIQTDTNCDQAKYYGTNQVCQDITTGKVYRGTGAAVSEISGTAAIVPRGAYAAGTTYAAGDGVSYQGSSYVAIQETTGNVPTNTTYWQVMAAKGDTGAAGDTGATGTAGCTVLYGTAAPTTEGKDCDFYIRTTTNYIYGPKATGTWPAGQSLIGPTGAAGTGFFSGSDGEWGAWFDNNTVDPSTYSTGKYGVSYYNGAAYLCINGTCTAISTLTAAHTRQAAATPVVDDADNFAANFTGDNLEGGTFVANAAGTANLAKSAVGQNYTIIVATTGQVILHPSTTGTTDTITMNGLAAAQGENIQTPATAVLGSICVIQYLSANNLLATCNGFAEATPP